MPFSGRGFLLSPALVAIAIPLSACGDDRGAGPDTTSAEGSSTTSMSSSGDASSSAGGGAQGSDSASLTGSAETGDATDTDDSSGTGEGVVDGCEWEALPFPPQPIRAMAVRSNGDLLSLQAPYGGDEFVGLQFDLATGDWGLPTDAITNESVGGTRLELNASDVGIGVWDEVTTITSSRFDPRTDAWGTAEVHSDFALGNPGEPRVGIDEAGNVLLVYTQAGGLLSRFYDVTTEDWTDIVRVDMAPDGAAIGGVALGVSSGGVGFATWQQTAQGSATDVYVSRFSSGTWSAPEQLAADVGGYEDRIGLVVDSADNATVMWLVTGSEDNRYFTRHYDAQAMTWSMAVPVDESTSDTQAQGHLRVDGEGVVSAAWISGSNQGTQSVWSNRFDAGVGAWDAPARLGENTSSNLELGFEMLPDGSGIVSWVEGSLPGQNTVLMRCYDPAEGWSESVVLSESGWFAPSIASGHSGYAYATWRQGDLDVPAVAVRRP